MASLSRRQFLGISAVACTTASTAGLAAASGLSSTSTGAPLLRLGLVGCGSRGIELLEACRSRSSVCIIAAADVYEPHRWRAAALGVATTPDWRALVERRDVDGIIIATPDHWHAQMAVAAMQAGKDVYCERPMALNLAEARTMRDTARETGRVLQIGAVAAADGQWRAMRDVVDSGAIGPVLWAQGAYRSEANSRRVPDRVEASALDWKSFQGPATPRDFVPERFAEWRRYWDYSAGLAVEHHYDEIVGLLLATGVDYPTRVSAAGGVYARDGREVPNSLVMTAEYKDGATLVLASGMAGLAQAPAVVRGRDGAVSWSGGSIQIDSADGRPAGYKPVNASADLLADWVEAVATRRPCLCGPDLGYRAMVVLSMAAEAYRRGKAMTYDPARETVAPCMPTLIRA